MAATPDQPLELPTRTLVAFDNARHAALHARQSIELSRAPLLAGLGVAAIGIGSFIIATDASLAGWAKWTVAGLALLISWGGVGLTYYFLWTWLRRGRLGGRQSPFSDACAQHGSRRRFGFLAIAFSFVLFEFIGWQALKGHVPESVCYGVMIWGTRLAILAGSVFFVNRFLRSGFWEYLVFAAGIVATGGLYIFVPNYQLNRVSPAPILLAVLSMLAAIAAAALLVRRWRRWAQARESAAEIEEPASLERE